MFDPFYINICGASLIKSLWIITTPGDAVNMNVKFEMWRQL